MLFASSLIPGLFCLGLLVVLLFPKILDEASQTQQTRWTFVAIVLASGMLSNYFLVLAVGSLRRSIALSFVGAIVALGTAIAARPSAMRDAGRFGAGPLLAFLAAAMLFGASILFEPLVAWDARSIWFFHAKIIHYQGGLFREAAWTLPTYAFSHPEYPKLAPALAAEVTTLAGYWNEYLPKLSLLLLLLPALAFTVGYWRAPMSLAAFVLLVWFKLGPHLVTGYMDAQLALYGLCGVILVARWLTLRALHSLVGGVVFIAMAVGLKNEGSLLAVATLACVAAYPLFRRASEPRHTPGDRLRLGVFLIAVAVGSGAWFALARSMGLDSDLRLGPESFARLAARLHNSNALLALLQATLIDNGLIVAALIGASAILLSRFLVRGNPAPLVICFAVATAYLLGIEIVYLQTPLDLGFHLRTSASRVTLLPTVLLLAPAFLFFEEIRVPTASGQD